MGKSILIINGSTRESGNTDSIIDKMIAGAKSVGQKINHVKLRDSRIGNCVGCCTCKKESKCQLQDDMTKIRNLIEQSDLMVFATPLYWSEITGLMKTFIDRLYFYHHIENRHLIAGKKVHTATTLGEAINIDYETEVIREFYRRLFKSLDVEVLEHLFYYGLMEKDDIQKKSQYLQEAFSFGLELCSL